jgi:hypothetical protein
MTPASLVASVPSGARRAVHAFAERLKQAGQPPKAIFVAGLRQLWVIMNAMLKHNTPWPSQGARPRAARCPG